MAAQRSQPRSSRKRRRQAPAGGAPAPRRSEATASRPAAHEHEHERDRKRSRPRPASPLGAYGERPPSPFGGLPVSEVAIFAGAVALIVGIFRHGGAALIGGVILCLLGVGEVTGREHFSGYRSHTVLLAAIPAVVAEFVIVLTVGPPAVRVLLLVPVAAVFGACAWFLRRRFLVARQARLARPLER